MTGASTPGSRRHARLKPFMQVGEASRRIASGKLGQKAAVARCGHCGAFVAELWTYLEEWVGERRCACDTPLPTLAQTAAALRRHARTGKTTTIRTAVQ